jgi:hypothetical protein
MTRIVTRHMVSAIAAVTLVSALATSPASAYKAWHCSNFRMEVSGLPSKPKTAKGLVAQRSGETAYGYRSEYTARATASHYQWRWWQDYSNGGR